jgi:hypothetical protein
MELKSRIILCEPQILTMVIFMNVPDMIFQAYKRKRFSLLRSVKYWVLKASTFEKLYRIGILFLLISFVPFIGLLIVTLGVFSITQRDFFLYLWLFLLGAACSLTTIGFIYEAKLFLINTWSKPIGKTIITGLIALVAFISFLCARYAVNLTLGVDPSYLPYALAAITAIVTPFVWMVISIVILFVFYVFLLLYAFLISRLNALNASSILVSIQSSKYYNFMFRKKTIPHHRSTMFSLKADRAFARALACVTLLISLSFPLDGINQNSSSINKFLTQVIVITNFYPISGCKTSKNYVSGKTYAFIGDGMIITAVPNKDRGYTFEPPRKCNHENKSIK